ncbi:MAG: glycoside hydrolase family 3 C-terminal domain-containing protein [Paludibacteraceae bacterium]|nr:glycoside hydrolase family 3 C-terminal domain-containing protein [Paludibacteraceae bacterium]
MIIQKDGYILVNQGAKGPTLGLAAHSTVQLIEQDGLWFKNLSRSGKLEPYEDWRLPVEQRVKDLVARLSIEEIAGLMLYSGHQAVPATSYDVSHYNGHPFDPDNDDHAALTDHQKAFLERDHVRHLLVTIVESPRIAARWSNNVQAFVENLPWGIPANNSSDPRHSARKDAEFNAGGGGQISMWPGPLGLAATFSPSIVETFGKIASREYRALGFTTALSPQIDLATDPRWYRNVGSMGSNPELVTELARAYIDGFQTSDADKEIADGWGYESVNCMVKHWPGGGACEAGRDAHYGFGKYAVYPGGQFEQHKKPFTEGAFRLHGKTGKAAAVMPYYMIPFGMTDENVGNAFNREIITHQLREQQHYDGVVCTDWRVTEDEVHPGIHSGKPWGVEQLTVAERHYKALLAGCDQFGGNSDIQPVLEAYQMGVRELDEETMNQRMRLSAARLLRNIFRLGLFENPYIDPDDTEAVVGSPELMQAGYEAQLDSIVLLKNHGAVLPLKPAGKAYIPNRYCPEYRGYWGTMVAAKTTDPVPEYLCRGRFTRTTDASEADYGIVFIESPMGGSGYSLDDLKSGGNGYMPISLQYEDYCAEAAREQSIAGGDPHEAFTNRCYKGKTTHTINKADMQLVQDTRHKLQSKPLIVVVNTANPFVMTEIEPYADAVLLTFDVQTQAALDIVFGSHEPSARLPFQMPADMQTVEEHCEDKPLDLRCYTDTDAHTYDFGYGLNWQGIIRHTD